VASTEVVARLPARAFAAGPYRRGGTGRNGQGLCGQAGATRRGSDGRRLVFRCQGYLFFPLLPLEAVNLHVASVRALTGRTRPQLGEQALLAAHFAGYFAAVFLVLSPVRAAVSIIVQQVLFGLYLGCSFGPNHKGMPILEAASQSDFLRRQVLTSRNVRGGWLTDFALGGLNYQLEHHLFPSMPRPGAETPGLGGCCPGAASRPLPW
jgi:Fatty acid desaturase